MRLHTHLHMQVQQQPVRWQAGRWLVMILHLRHANDTTAGMQTGFPEMPFSVFFLHLLYWAVCCQKHIKEHAADDAVATEPHCP